MATIIKPFNVSHNWDKDKAPAEAKTTAEPVAARSDSSRASPDRSSRWKTFLNVVIVIAVIAAAIIIGTAVVKLVSGFLKYPTVIPMKPEVPAAKPPLSSSGYALYPALVKETTYTTQWGGLSVESAVKPVTKSGLPGLTLSPAVKVGVTVAAFGLSLLGGGGRALSKAFDYFVSL